MNVVHLGLHFMTNVPELPNLGKIQVLMENWHNDCNLGNLVALKVIIVIAIYDVKMTFKNMKKIYLHSSCQGNHFEYRKYHV